MGFIYKKKKTPLLLGTPGEKGLKGQEKISLGFEGNPVLEGGKGEIVPKFFGG